MIHVLRYAQVIRTCYEFLERDSHWILFRELCLTIFWGHEFCDSLKICYHVFSHFLLDICYAVQWSYLFLWSRSWVLKNVVNLYMYLYLGNLGLSWVVRAGCVSLFSVRSRADDDNSWHLEIVKSVIFMITLTTGWNNVILHYSLPLCFW